MSFISLEAVSFYHRDALGRRLSQGIADIDLKVETGKVISLVGPNGSGKSTVIKLCMGFAEPTKGKVSRSKGTLLSYISDGGRSLYPNLNLVENIEYMLAIRGIGYCSGIGDAARKISSYLGLDDIRIPVSSMSRGMRQKASIVCSMLTPHEFLFADEPTLGLDFASQCEFETILREEKERGRGVCIATNDMAMAGRISDEIIVISKGRFTKGQYGR